MGYIWDMRLKAIILKNFRAFREQVRIEFDDLTAFIGRNDVGKSSIFEALAIFFENTQIKIDQQDLCVHSRTSQEITIGCVFADIPKSIILDESAETSLSEELLLNANNELEIHKIYDCANKNPKAKIYLKANYSIAPENLCDLILLKNADLKKRWTTLGIENKNINLTSNPSIRKALREHYKNQIQLQEKFIELNKEDSLKIWEKIKNELPVFALFQSDRSSKDNDSEIQDPLKYAVQEAISNVRDELAKIQKIVENQVFDVARRTIKNLQEMEFQLANELTPIITKDPQWDSLFKFSLTGDNQIPINKRGSGVRRLILLNFFKAEAQRKQEEEEIKKTSKGIIYAIEEPETSQHPNHQKMILNALTDLSEQDDCQVFITTHSPGLISCLPKSSLRYIYNDNNDRKKVCAGNDEDCLQKIFDEIRQDLGIISDNLIKALIYVEGPNDITFLKNISSIMNANNPDIVDLSTSPHIMFVPFGGGTFKHWVDQEYLKELNHPEFYLCDGDRQDYKDFCCQIEKNKDNAKTLCLSKNSIENYLHFEAIKEEYDIDIKFSDSDNVAEIVAIKLHEKNTSDKKWAELEEDKKEKKIKKAKNRLNKNVSKRMTINMLKDSDKLGELENFLKQISFVVNSTNIDPKVKIHK